VAKVTGGNKSSAARWRSSRNSGGLRDTADESAPDGATGEATGEDMADGEMAVGMENDDMETGVDEVVESPSASAVALSSDAAVARGATRAPARTGPPEALMANPVTRFIVEAYLELRKVTWPRPDEAWNMTLVVIAMSAFVAILLGVADLGLAKALTFLVSLGGH
jgi:preprotein translocase subunit SecE